MSGCPCGAFLDYQRAGNPLARCYSEIHENAFSFCSNSMMMMDPNGKAPS